MLRSASKNLSLRKTAAPLSLACKLWKLAQLQRGKLTEDLRQLEMWHSKFSSPRESSLFVCGPAKPWQLIFFCRDAKASRLASGFAGFAFCECVCLKKRKKRGVQTFLRVAVRFLALSLCPFPSHSYHLWNHVASESREHSVCAQGRGAPFRNIPASLQQPRAGCFLVQNVLHSQQKWQRW